MWPHAPNHIFEGSNTFMVTASTLNHEHHFRSSARLELIQKTLFELAEKYHWELHAWAIFSNHYHFVAQTNSAPKSLKRFLTHLHANTAREVNRQDGVTGRQVWFQFWDSRLTFENSYLARLKYTHENAVRHGLVSEAKDYPYSSASWFERTAPQPFRKKLSTFQAVRVSVNDEYEPVWDTE